MDILTPETLQSLITRNAGPRVSLYMPTHRGGVQAREDGIRLKNLLRRAEESLGAMGLRSPEARALVQPAKALLEDKPFWQHQDEGLAVFLAPEEIRYYRVPLRFDELLVVADHYHVKPLLPLLVEEGRFFLLALSKKDVRLRECTRHHCKEVALQSGPKSLAEFLRFDVPEGRFQVRARATGSVGNRPATVGGHAGGPDEAIEKTRVLEYFRQVDHSVRKVLKAARAPLVLAGVEYLRGIYKEANHYANLVPEGIDGSPEGRGEQELHSLAWGIVEPHFLKGRAAAAAQFRQLHGTERASKDLKVVVPAAYQGRVGLLLLSPDVCRWGTFDPETRAIELHADEQPGDKELLDFAATHTLLHGGAVHAVGPEHLPSDAPLAAVLRP